MAASEAQQQLKELHSTVSADLDKIRRELGFVPKRSIEDAARGLFEAFRAGRIPDPMSDSRYYNIKTMLEAKL